MTKKTPPTMRQQVVQAAKDADVPIDDWDRAQVLGQLAGLLAAHPSIAGKIAFKGGAVMHLIDGSPRLSRDLDGLVRQGRLVIHTAWSKEALVERHAARPREAAVPETYGPTASWSMPANRLSVGT